VNVFDPTKMIQQQNIPVSKSAVVVLISDLFILPGVRPEQNSGYKHGDCSIDINTAQ